MCVGRRIDEVVTLLERFALGEIDLPKERVVAAIRLLDLMIDDAPPPDDGDEMPTLADDQVVLMRAPKFAA